MARVSYVVFLVIIRLFLLSVAQEEKGFNPRCPRFHCGSLGDMGFPFSNRTHPERGLLIVHNCSNAEKLSPKIQLGKHGPWFYIKSISQDNTVGLQDHPEDLEHLDNRSCKPLENLSLPIYPFLSFEMPYNQSIYKCPDAHSIDTKLKFSCNDSKYPITYFGCEKNHLHIPSQCSLIPFKANKTQKGVDFLNLFTRWFFLKVQVPEECYECHYKGGQCQSDIKGKFLCSNSKAEDGKLQLELGVGLAAGIGILIIVLALCFKIRKRLLWNNSVIFRKNKNENYHNIEVFLRNHGSLAPKRYGHSEIKKMTNSFKQKLGQGGYGCVYKGRLYDGRNVAVKVLTEFEGNGEEFINEVASISRTSHVNIVTLLGFCFEGSRRALVYEFVSNGSLDKFIYEKDPVKTDQQLKWETLYQIAIGIARGLEYLHRGCSTRILHLDIKPHNILLDEDFCPKISDFGLAKICSRKESIVSMTGARGTIGYIAPEVFCRNFGQVSHKSDVYSYGMMILEMVGGRRNIGVEVDRTSEIYFPHWIYQRLEVDEELRLQGIPNEENKECARKMIIVSLWCIQTNPSERPTISRVVDMLGGGLGSLQIPPKPFLFSPTRQILQHSCSDNIVIL